MRAIRILAALACACMLTGCASLLDREYTVVEEHSSKYWESGTADTMRAESYQDIVNDLLLLVGQHTENAILRLYGYEDDTVVADDLERAASEVQLETPMGAYAVEYITSETQRQRSFYEVSVRVGYRRSLEQIQAVVNATSTAALPDLLNAALMAEKTELAVRIGYWNEESASRVEQTVEEIREKWDLTETPPWTVAYYPAEGKAGLLEFIMDGTQEQVPEPGRERELSQWGQARWQAPQSRQALRRARCPEWPDAASGGSGRSPLPPDTRWCRGSRRLPC